MSLRFLVDACCSRALAARLSAQGHDVLRVASIDPDLSDDAVAAFARSSGRILITDDKEFGERALLRGELPDGVVLVRLPGAESSSDKDARVAAVIAEMGEAVGRALVVITPERVRSRRLQGG